MDIAAFGIAKVEMFILVLARTLGIFTLVPIFGASQVPVMARIITGVAMALLFMPLYGLQTAEPIAMDVPTMAMLVAREAAVGAVIGFVTIMVFAAIQAAGDFIDMHAGFSFATMVDPVYGTQTAIAGRVHHILAGLIFFVANCHHIMLCGLADSFKIAPVGTFALSPNVADGFVVLFGSLFAVALRIAAPVVAAVFLADVAIALVSRAVPQMNAMMVGFPLKLGVGMVGMFVAMPVAIALTRATLGSVHGQTSSLVRLLISP